MSEQTISIPADSTPAASPTTVERLRRYLPADTWISWAITLGVTLLAFVLRIYNVAFPKSLLFDETYYPKDAWSMLHIGYEGKWENGVNEKIVDGVVNLYSTDPAFVVHPPLGKWLIAIGEAMFGMNSFGWRFSAVVAGSVMVLLVIRLARRLSGSLMIGVLAGLFITFDGLSFVMSRIGLLDGFQAMFLVAAALAVVVDRDWFRNRLARYLDVNKLTDLGGSFGPTMWVRPWRIVAGVMFGCAIGVKWNSLFFMAALCVLSLWWDISARRLAGARDARWAGVLRDGVPAFVYQCVVAGLVYTLTWIRWFTTSGGYDRDFGVKNPDHFLVKTFGPLIGSWIKYHEDINGFHTGDYIRHQTHPYQGHPAGWLFMVRPVGVDAQNGIKPGENGCPADVKDSCIRVISAMGTPVLWWAAAIALVAAMVWWILGRDWRFGLVVVAALSTYIPWFFFAERPVFFFYAINLIPFTAIGLALAIGKLMGTPEDPSRRRLGGIIGGVLLALVIFNFAFIHPILTDELLPRDQWSLRMWLNSWI